MTTRAPRPTYHTRRSHHHHAKISATSDHHRYYFTSSYLYIIYCLLLCDDALPLVLYGCVLSPLLIPQVLTSSAGKAEHSHVVVGHPNINIQIPSSFNLEAWWYGSHCCLRAGTLLKFYRTRRRGIRGTSSGERFCKKEQSVEEDTGAAVWEIYWALAGGAVGGCVDDA